MQVDHFRLAVAHSKSTSRIIRALSLACRLVINIRISGKNIILHHILVEYF